MYLAQVALIQPETEEITSVSWILASTPQVAVQKAIKTWIAAGVFPVEEEAQRKYFISVILQGEVQFPGKIVTASSVIMPNAKAH